MQHLVLIKRRGGCFCWPLLCWCVIALYILTASSERTAGGQLWCVSKDMQYLSISDCVVVNPHLRVHVLQVPLKAPALQSLSQSNPFRNVSKVNSGVLQSRKMNKEISLHWLYGCYLYWNQTGVHFVHQAVFPYFASFVVSSSSSNSCCSVQTININESQWKKKHKEQAKPQNKSE